MITVCLALSVGWVAGSVVALPEKVVSAQSELAGAASQRQGDLFAAQQFAPPRPAYREGRPWRVPLLTVAQAPEPHLPLANGAAPIVTEGVGWGGFQVGATRDAIAKVVGPPEANPNPQSIWVRWISKYHIDCIFDMRSGGANEIRFNKGFPGTLTSGIKIGSSEQEVVAAYGKPGSVVNRPKSKMFQYPERGVLMWIVDGKVADFTVFPPRKPHQ